jgi:CxxC-x17-CxxC domain-containing protein
VITCFIYSSIYTVSMSYEKKDFELHDAICAKCKKATQVPFKPTGDKPVKCRDCFQADRPARDDSRGGDRKFGGDRGGDRRTGGGARNTGDTKKVTEQLDAVHKKMDLILESLGVQHTISNTATDYKPKKLNSRPEAPKEGELKGLLEKVVEIEEKVEEEAKEEE